MEQTLLSISAITVANKPSMFVAAPDASVNLVTIFIPQSRPHHARDSRSVNSRVSTLPMVRSSPSGARYARRWNNFHLSLFSVVPIASHIMLEISSKIVDFFKSECEVCAPQHVKQCLVSLYEHLFEPLLPLNYLDVLPTKDS